MPGGGVGRICLGPSRESVKISSAIMLEEEEQRWREWYELTPLERWHESEKLWETFLTLGGSLDPEPDSQSPFYDPEASPAGPADGRPGLRVLRRSGV